MTTSVKKITDQVKTLSEGELDEFLSWLADYEQEHFDSWDKEIAQDFQPEGRLSSVLDRVREDIAAGRTKPLDEIVDNT